MRTQRNRIFVGDFETTVYDGQESTEVWAAAIVELNTEDVLVLNSISELYNFMVSLNSNIIIYFHNLKFDGQFWLSFLINDLHMEQAITVDQDNVSNTEFAKKQKMRSNTFRYSISEMGQWYSIIIKTGVNYIEIRDSLKLLPFSVKKIGKGFKTKHQKLDMEYKGYRYAGCEITDAEKEYIANDVLVVKEALEIMYNEGHTSLTIGSCCMEEYKHVCPFMDYKKSLPNLYEVPLEPEIYTYDNAGEYIRKSYRGGWCYVVPEKTNKIIRGGTTADVNSLYPSMMHSESGNIFPIGNPVFWSGNYIPDEAQKPDSYYFIRFKCRFKIKPNYLPFIQVKSSMFYKSNECLTTSDIRLKDGTMVSHFKDADGTIKLATVTMTCTMTDYALIREHYDLTEFEILDGCYFRAYSGIFDDYIDKYKKIKMENKGAKRELAKLFLNNLYGKMASNTSSSFKVAFPKDDLSLGYYTVIAHEKTPGYIPIGSAITSYARNFTIRAAQKNYYGPNKRGFIYADTDSIHCDLSPEDITGIKVHDTNFCCWKLESSWDEALFVRQKTYAEHVVQENLEPIPQPYWNIKCAGMPERCKDLFMLSMNEETKTCVNDPDCHALLATDYSEEELNFLRTTRTISDFKIGLVVPGKLLPRTIKGGVVLTEVPYEMRPSIRF